MTGIHAVRVAAKLRRELNTGVDTVRARYGEFKVLVDGETVIDAGAAAFLGVLPSSARIIAAVREGLRSEPRGRANHVEN